MSKFKNMLAAAALVAKRATMEADATIEGVRMRQATRMLELFKEMLAEHKLHNHEIRIYQWGGQTWLRIDGQSLTEYDPAWSRWMEGVERKLPVLGTLRWIDSQFGSETTDEAPWALRIPDNTLLNERKEP